MNNNDQTPLKKGPSGKVIGILLIVVGILVLLCAYGVVESIKH